MSANEITNSLAAQLIFHGAASTGALLVYRTMNVDETAAGTTKGVERLSAGRYKVHLINKLVPSTHADGPNVIGYGSVEAGFTLHVGADQQGDLSVYVNTDAGVASDASYIYVQASRFPTAS